MHGWNSSNVPSACSIEHGDNFEPVVPTTGFSFIRQILQHVTGTSEEVEQLFNGHLSLAQNGPENAALHIPAVMRHHDTQVGFLGMFEDVVAAGGVVDIKPARSSALMSRSGLTDGRLVMSSRARP